MKREKEEKPDKVYTPVEKLKDDELLKEYKEFVDLNEEEKLAKMK